MGVLMGSSIDVQVGPGQTTCCNGYLGTSGVHGTQALYPSTHARQAMTSSSQLPYNKGLAGWLRICKLRIASNQVNISSIRLAHQMSFPRKVVPREGLRAAYPGAR